MSIQYRPTKYYAETVYAINNSDGTLSFGTLTTGPNPFPEESADIKSFVESRKHVLDTLRIGWDAETGEIMSVSTRSNYHGTTRSVYIDDCPSVIAWKARFEEQSANPECPPAIGSGMTMGYGSDRYAYTVIEVTKSGKTVTIQADDQRQVGDYYRKQEWICTPNPQGGTYRCRWNAKRGVYVCDRRAVGFGRYPNLDPHF